MLPLSTLSTFSPQEPFAGEEGFAFKSLLWNCGASVDKDLLDFVLLIHPMQHCIRTTHCRRRCFFILIIPDACMLNSSFMGFLIRL